MVERKTPNTKDQKGTAGNGKKIVRVRNRNPSDLLPMVQRNRRATGKALPRRRRRRNGQKGMTIRASRPRIFGRGWGRAKERKGSIYRSTYGG